MLDFTHGGWHLRIHICKICPVCLPMPLPMPTPTSPPPPIWHAERHRLRERERETESQLDFYYLFKRLIPFSTHKCVCHSAGNVRLSQVWKMYKLKTGGEWDKISTKKKLHTRTSFLSCNHPNSVVSSNNTHTHTNIEFIWLCCCCCCCCSQMENGRRTWGKNKENLKTLWRQPFHSVHRLLL